MAEVYDYVQGVPGSKVTRTLPNGARKTGQANQLERVIALTEEAQRAVLAEGMKVFQRANFRMNAVQARRIMALREALLDAIQGGDPDEIKMRQDALNEYQTNKTKVTWSQADVDFHVSLFRADGRELHVEVDNQFGRGGIHALKQSLTG